MAPEEEATGEFVVEGMELRAVDFLVPLRDLQEDNNGVGDSEDPVDDVQNENQNQQIVPVDAVLHGKRGAFADKCRKSVIKTWRVLNDEERWFLERVSHPDAAMELAVDMWDNKIEENSKTARMLKFCINTSLERVQDGAERARAAIIKERTVVAKRRMKDWPLFDPEETVDRFKKRVKLEMKALVEGADTFSTDPVQADYGDVDDYLF